ncbi:mitochondrial ATP synthase delta subunit, putative [Plasmodium malariae]|uniref:Mitochondrial ATP synthase delta subunit, putative n=1 Tax=Plasmodium malariae TaxID=5858 RepID=A0A1C3L261_PLAMA|nr:mitochondrial ATP synthase delta subunit, putative [Plasmodium malariae]
MKTLRCSRQLTRLTHGNMWKHFQKNDYSVLLFYKRNIRSQVKNNKVSYTTRYYSNSFEEEKKNTEEYYLSMGDNIEKRYSLALYNVGKRSNKINEISSDILFVKNNFLKDKVFLNFLHIPNIENKEKLDFLKNQCKKYNNNNFSTITSNFLESLFDSKRINFLPKIIEEFELLLMKDRKEIKCTVYTAKELDNSYKKKVHDSILYRLKNELKPLIEYKTDATILGGLVLKIGNQVFDFSAKSKIEKIKSTLL